MDSNENPVFVADPNKSSSSSVTKNLLIENNPFCCTEP